MTLQNFVGTLMMFKKIPKRSESHAHCSEDWLRSSAVLGVMVMMMMMTVIVMMIIIMIIIIVIFMTKETCLL